MTERFLKDIRKTIRKNIVVAINLIRYTSTYADEYQLLLLEVPFFYGLAIFSVLDVKAPFFVISNNMGQKLSTLTS